MTRKDPTTRPSSAPPRATSPTCQASEPRRCVGSQSLAVDLAVLTLDFAFVFGVDGLGSWTRSTERPRASWRSRSGARRRTVHIQLSLESGVESVIFDFFLTSAGMGRRRQEDVHRLRDRVHGSFPPFPSGAHSMSSQRPSFIGSRSSSALINDVDGLSFVRFSDQHPGLQAPTLGRQATLLRLRGLQGHAREGEHKSESVCCDWDDGFGGQGGGWVSCLCWQRLVVKPLACLASGECGVD
jgi:hypothetical protein